MTGERNSIETAHGPEGGNHSHPADATIRRDRLAVLVAEARPATNEETSGSRQYAPTLSDQWQSFTLADAYKPRPHQSYVIENLFRRPSLSVVEGHAGSHKTNIAIDALCSVVSGTPWLPAPTGGDATPFATQQGPVVWINFDSATRTMHERFEAFGRAHGLREDAALFYYSFPEPHLVATERAAMIALCDRVKRLGAVLVVIDCLGSIRGAIEENSQEMLRVMFPLRRLSEETGAAVVAIHHASKGGGYRGSSVIRDAVDLMLSVEREPGSRDIVISPSKTREADVAPFGATFEFMHKSEVNELAWARFRGFRVKRQSEHAEAEEAILAILADEPGGLNGAELVKKAKVDYDLGKNLVRDLAGKLAGKGVLHESPGPKNSKVYCLIERIQGHAY